MDGSFGPQAERIRDFSRALEASGFGQTRGRAHDHPDARRVLLEGDVRRAKRKEVVDKLAAISSCRAFWMAAVGLRKIRKIEGGPDMEDNRMESGKKSSS
jgi:hypothetical protein